MPARLHPRTLLYVVLSSAIHASLVAALAFADLGYAAASAAATNDSKSAASEEAGRFSAAELDELVAPIALYPDELLGITLPASTYPLEIVQAARFLEKQKKDPDLKPSEKWDSSVLGLLNYPEVVEKMNSELDWTTRLGDAVASQQADVTDAVQRFRARVDEAGNLESNDKFKVVKETPEQKQIIVIESASPEVIYVPSYQPSTVVIVHSAPYPYYYSAPYPYYYNPAAAFWTGMFVGAAISYGVGWGHGYGGHGYHHGVVVDGDVNINVDRSNTNISNRKSNRDSSGAGWKADENRGRDGKRTGRSEQGTASRQAADRKAKASTSRQAASSRNASGSRAGTSYSGKAQAANRYSTGRRATHSATSRSSRNSSFGGGYKSGSRSHSSRGSVSRGRGSSGRKGGGRGGGGRRR